MATANFYGFAGKPLRPVGSHTQVADVSSATTIPVVAGGKHVLLQAKTQAITVTFDGTAPTASKGFLVPAGDALFIEANDGMTIKVIETAGTGSVEYQWFE